MDVDKGEYMHRLKLLVHLSVLDGSNFCLDPDAFEQGF